MSNEQQSNNTNIVPMFFENMPVRIVKDENDTPWWVAKDVCDILDYQNPSKTLSDHLDDDERSNVSLGRQGMTNIINESGLYTLIVRSNKPQAKPFRKWVTSEVLPSIRKTGTYAMPGANPEFDLHRALLNTPIIQNLANASAQMMEILHQMQSDPSRAAGQTQRFMDTSAVQGFVERRCHLKRDSFITKNALYDSYSLHCDDAESYKESKPNFFVKLYRAYPAVNQGRVLVDGVRTPIVTGIGMEDLV